MPETLEQLLARIGACRLCRDNPKRKPLPHEPRPVLRASSTARVIICGQAPGTRVHASGKPFTDPSGDRLREWLALDEATFYDRRRIAIVPMGFCFPGHDAKGGDLPPRPECAPAWRDSIFAHLTDARLLVLVGAYAIKWHLSADARPSLTETVAEWRAYQSPEAFAAHHSVPTFPLPHPSWRNNAWLKRNSWFGAELLPELRQAVATALDGS